MADKDTPAEIICVEEEPLDGLSVMLTIPAGSQLGPALVRRQKQLQAIEYKLAKIGNREHRTITIQDVILRNCCLMEGVDFI